MKNNFVKTLFACAIFLSACDLVKEGETANSPVSRPENLVEIPAEKPVAPAPISKPVQSSTHRYGSNAKECLIKGMYFEARGTGERGMRAVGEVILNRADDSRFPNTACGVLNQYYNGTCQFSFICDSIPDRYREPKQREIAERLANDILYRRGKDITNGALFFHAATMKPGWFGTLSKRGKFGRQLFYR